MSELNTYLFSVDKDSHNLRLDKFLAQKLKEQAVSREKIKEAILTGFVSINNIKTLNCRQAVKSEQNIQIDLTIKTNEIQAEKSELNIIYQDDYLIVLDKPPNLTVHPCPSCPDSTLVNRLLFHFPELKNLEGERPGIVHRLDKDTSGLIIIALDEKTRLKLNQDFSARLIEKTYLAIVHKVPPQEHGIINKAIVRHPSLKTKMSINPNGKTAISEYKVLYKDPDSIFSVVAIKIHTGRTHQIRVHFAHLGNPLIGDTLYGGKKNIAFKELTDKEENPKHNLIIHRQMLHAMQLKFTHPITADLLNFTCPLPKDFLDNLRRLACFSLRIIITGTAGSGKSSLLNFFQKIRLPVFSADQEVAKLYSQENDYFSILKNILPEEVFKENTEKLFPKIISIKNNKINKCTGINEINESNKNSQKNTAKEKIDHQALFLAMQKTPELKQEIEHFIHPIIAQKLESFWQKNKDYPIIVAEIPLYFETNFHKKNKQKHDKPIVIGVSCLQSIKNQRLLQKGLNQEKIDTLRSWQLSENKKMKLCDFVLNNNNSLSELEEQANVLTKKLIEIYTQNNKEYLNNILQTIVSYSFNSNIL